MGRNDRGSFLLAKIFLISHIMLIENNKSLRHLNTFGLDQQAAYFTTVKDEVELSQALQAAEQVGVPVFILGGGSNILLTRDLPYFVIKIDIKGIEIVQEDSKHLWVRVGAGEIWHDFVRHAIANQWGGVENLSLIPGTVGASPMQNIGAYGVEIKDIFDHLEALRRDNGEQVQFSAIACEFGYRDSIFKGNAKDKFVITRVIFRLDKFPVFNTSYGDIAFTMHELGYPEPSLEAVSAAVIHIRRKKLPDPSQLGNAGSFFKNPVVSEVKFAELKQLYPHLPGFSMSEGMKIPAAWLIEQAGWKGKRWGNIGVHTNQPLVLVNYGGGKGEDLLFLSESIAKDVARKFGVSLQTEVNLV
jgi:UDP-N-acetylmuramate dehydrogenase